MNYELTELLVSKLIETTVIIIMNFEF